MDAVADPGLPLRNTDGWGASRSYAWYVVSILSAGHLVSFIDRFVMSLVLTPLKAQMHLSDGQLGLIQGLGFVIFYSVAGIPIGRLADTVSRRGMIAVGILIWSLATAACAFAQTYDQLFAARLMVGFGEAALVPAAMSLIGGYFEPTEMARPVSTFTMGAPIGRTVALVGGAWLLGLMIPMHGLNLPLIGHLQPWQGVFLAASLPGFALIPFLLTIGNPPRGKSAVPGKASFTAVLRHIAAHRLAYATHLSVSCCAVLLVQSFSVWAPTLFIRMHGLSVPQSGYVIGLTTLAASPAGNLFGGWVTARLQRRGIMAAPLLVIGFFLLLAVPLAYLLLSAATLTAAIILFGVLTFFLSATSGPALSALQILTPMHQRGAATAIYMCIMTVISVGLGPTIVGFLSDGLFSGAKGLAAALQITTLGMSILALICIFLGWRAFAKSATEQATGF